MEVARNINSVVVSSSIYKGLRGFCSRKKALKKGIVNLERHIQNISKYTKNIVVCINRFKNNTCDEINYVKEFVKSMGYQVEVCNSFEQGSSGAIDLANKIIEVCNNDIDYSPLYNFNDSIINKINIISKEIYRANNVIMDENIIKK